MCFAVKYTDKHQQQQTVYVGQDATLPVLNAQGETQQIRWGRDKKEQGGAFAHHCARLESINEGKWSRYSPKAVFIQVNEFADWGTDKQVHWHVIPDGQGLRGALVQDGDVLRVYIVTVPVIEEMKQWSKGGRWPRVVSQQV